MSSEVPNNIVWLTKTDGVPQESVAEHEKPVFRAEFTHMGKSFFLGSFSDTESAKQAIISLANNPAARLATQLESIFGIPVVEAVRQGRVSFLPEADDPANPDSRMLVARITGPVEPSVLELEKSREMALQAALSARNAILDHFKDWWTPSRIESVPEIPSGERLCTFELGGEEISLFFDIDQKTMRFASSPHGTDQDDDGQQYNIVTVPVADQDALFALGAAYYQLARFKHTAGE